MATTKSTGDITFPVTLRSKIRTSLPISYVYDKLGIEEIEVLDFYESWKSASDAVPTKFDKFFKMDLDKDTRIRFGYKLSSLKSIPYDNYGIDSLQVEFIDNQLHFYCLDDSLWEGELYIDNFDIKKPLDVAVMQVFNKLGIIFYWESYHWMSLTEEIQNIEETETEFPLSIYRKYEAIAEEWKTKLKKASDLIHVIEKHVAKSDISDKERMWYLLILYIHNSPEIIEFQSLSDECKSLGELFTVIPKNQHYQKSKNDFESYDSSRYSEGFCYRISTYEDEIMFDNLDMYPYKYPIAYDLIFNKQYWFNNFANYPIYADKITELVSTSPGYNRLSKFCRQSDLHRAFKNTQKSILRFYNFIKDRNKKDAEKSKYY